MTFQQSLETMREEIETLQKSKVRQNLHATHRNTQALVDVDTNIATKQTQLAAFRLELESVAELYAAQVRDLQQERASMQRCTTLVGLVQKCATESERQSVLSFQVDAKSKELNVMQSESMELMREQSTVQNSVENAQQERNDVEGAYQRFETELKRTENECNGMEREIRHQESERQGLMGMIRMHEEKHVKLSSSIRDYEQKLLSVTPQHIAKGLVFCQKLKRERLCPTKIMDGIFGPLYELFGCHDVFQVACEVAAGVSLFHLVVDNEVTAAYVLEALEKSHTGGYVTIIPLNRISQSQFVCLS